MKAKPLTETEFTSQLRDLAKLLGYRRYHTWLSKYSPAGFPDEVLVKPPRLIFAELKSDTGKVSADQEAWLEDLRKVPGIEVYVWRPRDWDEIVEVLSGQLSIRAA